MSICGVEPVRAGMVDDASHWAWSSYHGTVCGDLDAKWLAGERVLGLFSAYRKVAIQQYQQFVSEGTAEERIWNELRGQIYLGEDEFLAKSKAMLEGRLIDADIPSAQFHPERATPEQVLSDVASAYGLDVGGVLDRQNNREAYRAGVFLLRRACNLSLKEVAELAVISPSRVSQIQKQVDDEGLIAALGSYKVKA